MRIVDVGPGGGDPLDRYGSVGAALSRLAVGFREVHLNVIHLEPGGRLGRHPAGVPQLLLVVRGEGSVAGASGERTALGAGQAALWEAGEEHDTRADTAMELLVVEAPELRVGDVTLRMPEGD